MAGRLDGKVALITGGGSGMGAAHSAAFVAEGATVVVADISEEGLSATVRMVGPGCTAAVLDVVSESSWIECIDGIRARFGRLDILVNNAAVVVRAPISDTSVDDFRRVLNVNVVGAFTGLRAAQHLMAESGGGSVINISSSSGALGFPGLSAYGTSKWALRGLTKMAAAELADVGIRVNAVLPGLVETPMTAHLERKGGSLRGRPATPDEVSSVVVFLASDEASFVTGADFAVDGGETAVSRAASINNTSQSEK